MKIKHGLISCDSHAQEHPAVWTSRMSKAKWGDRIPQLVETNDRAAMDIPIDHPVQRWTIDNQVTYRRGTANCPTAMGDPLRKTFPHRWNDVPQIVYDPKERLLAQDRDRIDAEVLFPNYGGADGDGFATLESGLEMECVRAYNDFLVEEWLSVSDRYVPIAILPYGSGIDATVAEAIRAVKLGHKGVVMLSEPSQQGTGLNHINDRHWDPLWAACEEMDIPVHFHAEGGMNKLSMGDWSGYTRNQFQAMWPSGSFSLQAQVMPNLIFSGILDRFPGLQVVCAETGLGWVNFILEACDHEWEKHHLWTEGVIQRPSEAFHRQVHINFWFERAGVEQRHAIGLENIMWESDFPHATSTWPDSWSFVERSLEGVSDEERFPMMAGNAVKLYKLG